MGILLGVDYYPEQWPEEMWEQDADHMKECGCEACPDGGVCMEPSGSRRREISGLNGSTMQCPFLRTEGFRCFCVHQHAPLRCGHLRNILRSFRLEQTEEGSPSESVDTAA